MGVWSAAEEIEEVTGIGFGPACCYKEAPGATERKHTKAEQEGKQQHFSYYQMFM